MVHSVVVVDDDLHILDLLQLSLSIRGMEVVAFERTDSVMEALRQVKPDVVLLDLQSRVDGRAGLHLLAQIRADELTATIPVILMSADHDALTRHADCIRDLGAISLRKPFFLDRVCQMLEQAAA